jgi:hypothetical protein
MGRIERYVKDASESTGLMSARSCHVAKEGPMVRLKNIMANF